MTNDSRKQDGELSEDTQILFAQMRATLQDPVSAPGEAKTTPIDSLGEASVPVTEPLPDWRTAESAPTDVPSDGSADGPATAEAPQPSAPAPASPAPAWVAPQERRPAVRVGLLVWSGILVIMSLLIIVQMWFPFYSGPLLFSALLSAFGLVLIIAGITSGSRSRRQGGVPGKRS